jgi:hypothetical protein
MLMIEIAGGIILAVLILTFWRPILATVGVVFFLALAIGAIGLVIALAYGRKPFRCRSGIGWGPRSLPLSLAR